jgi:serine/threonine-protein kinase
MKPVDSKKQEPVLVNNDSNTSVDTPTFTKPVKKRSDTVKRPQPLIDETAEENDPPETSQNEVEPGRTVNAVSGANYRVINTAHFHDRPDESTRRNAYLLVNDVVITALDEQNDFIYIVFTNTDGQKSKGWILKKNLSSADE